MTLGAVLPAPAEPLLSVEGLSAEFQRRGTRRRVITDVSFDVGAGEFVGIVGETGSGKSVTLRSILRLLPANGHIVGGSVRYNGADLVHASRAELRSLRGSQLAFVPQQPWSALNPVLTLERQFRYVARAHGKLEREEALQRALEALRSVEIVDSERVLSGYAPQLSGGMAQRVVLALILQLDPRLVIADEPTTALDVTVQREVLDLLATVCRGAARSVLLVTHDLGVVAQYCDKVVVMRHGSVVERGIVREVFGNPKARYTAELLQAARVRGRA